MNTTILQNIGNEALEGRERPSNLIGRWITLIICLSLIWIFVFIIGPWIQQLPLVRPLAEHIESSGIDASALYYTEVDETGEALVNIRSTLEYSP